jgi:RNA polymerase sigma factor (sigma-70 family)
MSRKAARYALLLRICRGRGCSREDAKEVVQEAYLRFFEYQRTAKITDADYLLRRIAVNLSINHYHRAHSNRYDFVRVEKLDRRGILVHPAPEPERTLAAEQAVEQVVRVLRAVSPRTCQIFIAQRGGYSYEEIAAAFAIKPRTVEKHVAAAVLALEETMPTAFASEPRPEAVRLDPDDDRDGS